MVFLSLLFFLARPAVAITITATSPNVTNAPQTPANVVVVSMLEVGSAVDVGMGPVDVRMGTVDEEVESDSLGVGAVDAEC